MRRYYLLLLSVFLLTACDQDSADAIATTDTIKAETSAQAKGNVTLIKTVTEITDAYKQHPLKNNFTQLTQKIGVLDSISNQNQLFLSIRPANYVLLTLTDALKFTANEQYAQEYDSLAVSSKVRNYFSQLFKDEVNVQLISDNVNSDDALTVQEKELLFFILDCYENFGNGNGNGNGSGTGWDSSWGKKMIVAATLGFGQSPANAVFNVSLLIVAY